MVFTSCVIVYILTYNLSGSESKVESCFPDMYVNPVDIEFAGLAESGESLIRSSVPSHPSSLKKLQNTKKQKITKKKTNPNGS